MGYLNNVTGYREDLLANRAIVKHGNFALLTPDGLVKNIIPALKIVTRQSSPRQSWVPLLLIIWSHCIKTVATNRASVAKALKRSCM